MSMGLGSGGARTVPATNRSSGSDDEQLELQDELEAREGFDGWDVFDEDEAA